MPADHAASLARGRRIDEGSAFPAPQTAAAAPIFWSCVQIGNQISTLLETVSPTIDSHEAVDRATSDAAEWPLPTIFQGHDIAPLLKYRKLQIACDFSNRNPDYHLPVITTSQRDAATTKRPPAVRHIQLPPPMATTTLTMLL